MARMSDLTRIALGSIVILVFTAACSSGSSSTLDAQALAAQACSLVTDAPETGFDPQTAQIEDLSVLAAAAVRKGELADQAATADERWGVLSEASAAISAFAQRLLEVRMEGESTDVAITPAMWEQYKTASNAFIAECQAALALPSAS